MYTDEEIKLLIDESTESGLIDPEQNEYVDNIFDLGDKDAEAIMTPRTDVVCIDLDDPLEESLQTVLQYKYTRYPVCRGSKDRIVGFVHVLSLIHIYVRTSLAPRLSKLYLPKHVCVLDEFPRTGIGKIDRVALERDVYKRQVEAQKVAEPRIRIAVDAALQLRLDAREREERHDEAQHPDSRDAPCSEDSRAAGAACSLVARQREHAAADDERDDRGDEAKDAQSSVGLGNARSGGRVVRCGFAHVITVSLMDNW